jgi:hypothetical protein
MWAIESDVCFDYVAYRYLTVTCAWFYCVLHFVACISNCDSCSSASTCTTCAPGYFYNTLTTTTSCTGKLLGLCVTCEIFFVQMSVYEDRNLGITLLTLTLHFRLLHYTCDFQKSWYISTLLYLLRIIYI